MNRKVCQSENGERERRQPVLPVIRREPIRQTLTPREKVLKTLRLFRLVYEELDRDKDKNGDEFTTTMRTTYRTREILLRDGKGLNREKRVGAVPGIEVGDVFQYKTQLDLVGLHSDMMGGIDGMDIGGGRMVACSIVASEGNKYNNIFYSNGLVYSGVGGNVGTKGKKTSNQELVKGNLALYNSMVYDQQVRVIQGKKFLDQRQRGKRYTYLGLYFVQNYWQEQGPEGKILFKFRLLRATGQRALED